jgi:hypothetical protein
MRMTAIQIPNSTIAAGQVCPAHRKLVLNGTAGAGSWCRPTESAGCIDPKSFVATEKLDQPTKSDHFDLKRQSTWGISV